MARTGIRKSGHEPAATFDSRGPGRRRADPVVWSPSSAITPRQVWSRMVFQMPRIGVVSYLNSRPLVDGLDQEPGVEILEDVPSRLLASLLDGRCDLALCPAIDYQRTSAELVVVPVGAIGSAGETLTVRVFARRPLAEIERLDVDGDSHTSVALAQVICHAQLGQMPRIRTLGEESWDRGDVEAVLLIGDKVVSRPPPPSRFPYTLDLGSAWRDLTGLPFVFACWLARADRELGDLPARLAARRRVNAHRIAEMAAPPLPPGWTEPLARRYLGQLLSYELGELQVRGMTEFWTRCHRLGLVDRLRTLRAVPADHFEASA